MTMLDRIRNAARKNMTERKEAEAAALPVETKETVETALYIHNLDKEGHTLLITSDDSDASEFYKTIAAHVEKSNGTIDYYGFDLNGTMFADRTDSQTTKLALNLDEAWDLSVALATEVKERAMTEQPGKKIVVLIKDGPKLFTMIDTENIDLYKELLNSINTVIELGAAVGIHIFMEVDAATAEVESRNNFQNVINFN
jgi:hypothetical protein